ncbi:hypothetical protein RJ639_047848 [Escallonia herrerae]|uniref:Uncharacterized protein n=1 Tax=Escallonia herrerae TaxID=1293975 RepID=A0AA89B0L2_9ASTE|nr:hypothetical protein RJ639_047848 [Escallonia herrerae]
MAYAAAVKKRKIRRTKPAAGICSRCGGGARVADMKTSTRFCYVPFYWKSWKAIYYLKASTFYKLVFPSGNLPSSPADPNSERSCVMVFASSN